MVEWGATEELGRVCKAVGAIVGEAIVGGAALAIADTEAGRGTGGPGIDRRWGRRTSRFPANCWRP